MKKNIKFLVKECFILLVIIMSVLCLYDSEYVYIRIIMIVIWVYTLVKAISRIWKAITKLAGITYKTLKAQNDNVQKLQQAHVAHRKHLQQLAQSIHL